MPAGDHSQKAPASSESDEDQDHVRFGPLVGVGFPRPLSIGAMIKVERLVGFGIEYSVLPKISVGGVETTFGAITADARVFPFRGAFFIGLRAGHQSAVARATVTVAPYGSLSESAEADAWFINPRLGFLWTWKSGLTVGIDAGVQIPISTSLQTSGLPPLIASQVQTPIADATNVVNGTLPTVDLLKVGVLF